MLMPKRVKYRRVQRGRMKGKATRGNVVNYGEFGLAAQEPGWITSNQIEAARIAMTRYTKRGGQVWIKIFPDKPVTAKPAGDRRRRDDRRGGRRDDRRQGGFNRDNRDNRAPQSGDRRPYGARPAGQGGFNRGPRPAAPAQEGGNN